MWVKSIPPLIALPLTPIAPDSVLTRPCTAWCQIAELDPSNTVGFGGAQDKDYYSKLWYCSLLKVQLQDADRIES